MNPIKLHRILSERGIETRLDGYYAGKRFQMFGLAIENNATTDEIGEVLLPYALKRNASFVPDPEKKFFTAFFLQSNLGM